MKITSRTSRPPVRISHLLGLSIVVAMLAAVVGMTSASASHPPDGGGSIIPKLVQTANNQVSNTARNREIGGSNCNYYTTAIGQGTGGACTHLGWRTEEWCADFATWVFKTGGAQINGLTPLAASGYEYGRIHHTWHTTGPKVGDLAVYASQHHIGIVTAVHGAALTIVSGNTYRPGQSSGPIDAVAAHSATVSDMWGFASPVAKP